MENFNREVGLSKEAEEKRSAWKRFKSYAEVAALVTLMSLPGLRGAFGQEKGEEGLEAKSKIEELTKRAAERVRHIVTVIKEKGQAGKVMMTPAVGEFPIRRWGSSEKTVTTVGYKDDKPAWLIHEGNSASMCFFDNGADGSLDRIIVNNEKEGVSQKEASNNLAAFGSMEDMAKEANVVADLRPEKVSVYEISRFESGDFVIRVVDFQSGATSELSGDEAEKIVSKVQGSYTDSMEGLDRQISK